MDMDKKLVAAMAKSRPSHRYFVLVLLLVIFSACNTAAPASLLTPTATPLPDITVCATGCDYTTLQAAIDAEATVPGAVIGVRDAIHTESNILLHKSVTIQGGGAAQTIVQAHDAIEGSPGRVFFVPHGVTVRLRAMTIRHGNPRTAPEAGGGILNEGTLVVEDCHITANSGSAGGGIHSDGELTLLNTTVDRNTARGGGDSYLECSTGGGLKALNGTLTLVDSAVVNNVAEGKGGGIHIACKGTLFLINSTISGNATNDDGGGVYLNGGGHFIHATISNNIAKTGGGLYVRGSGEHNVIRGQLNYTNTLIADNVARMEKYGVADCKLGDYATISAYSYNWVADGNCNPAFSGDPQLALLVDDDASPPTHALLSGSSAIDAIPPESCVLSTDQRGLPRTTPCDIGAFEVQGK